MKSKLNPKAAAHLKGAQLALVETALVGFVETVLGRSFTDEEIMRCGLHLDFTGSAVPTFQKDGNGFVKFYVWDCREVLALGFLDEENPLALSVCRLTEVDWTLPLTMSIRREKAARKDNLA